jgi:alkanesulfonate monooxygenase SsuD/methylene tetrahydromethanopterin reductase-like flavin-dependent oxidoreductase (luciferase family)
VIATKCGDVVSGGRLITGRGTGWSPEEYQGVGLPWQERGARPDECLDVLEAVWTTEPVARHEGRHHTFPAAHIGHKPLQRPPATDLPVRLRPASRRRMTRRADGVLPVAVLVRGSAFDPATESTVPGIADIILRTGDETDVDHVFVDFVHLADQGVDQALELLRQTRELSR